MALSFEYDEAKLIFKYFAARPRDAGVVVDVGAQFGTSFRPYLNIGWRALAFEPDSTKWPTLQKYISNPLLTISNKAVSDIVKNDVQFFTSSESNGISSLLAFRDSHVPSEKVTQTTLRIELAAANITQIDYLKIDTEGYDYLVLQGHDWRILPEVIMCEFDEVKTRHIGKTHHDLGQLLLSRGYTVWCSAWQPLVKYGSGHTWHSMTPYQDTSHTLHHPDVWGNFIAVRPAGVKTMCTLIEPHV
jgi:FkbM family methyltransferase